MDPTLPWRTDLDIFSPVKQSRVTEDMFEQIFSRIADGNLKPGEKLPTERELAAQFGVSRSTVRETLRMLQHSGLIRIKYGSQGGAFVATDDWTPVSNALRMMLRLNQTPFAQLLEARAFIEAASARLAAARATPEHLAKLRSSLERLEANLDDMTVLNETNREFHITIAHAADNLVILATVQALQKLVAGSLEDLVRARTSAEVILTSHTEIYNAILERDADAAERAMNRHLQTIEKRAAVIRGRYVSEEGG